jgi:hypothetical protein
VLLEDGVERTQWLYDWAQSYQPADFNTVVVHGTEDGRFAESPVASGTVPPDIIAQLLKGKKGYDPKLPTQLVACSAGATKSGAQALANALGANVLAATQLLKPGPTLGSPPVAAAPPNTFWGVLQFQSGPPPPITWITYKPQN